MSYRKIKLSEVKSKELANIMHCKKHYAKNVLRKVSEFKELISETFIETDDNISYTATFCFCNNDTLVAKYVFRYTEKDRDCREYDAIYLLDGVLMKEVHSTTSDFRSKEYDKEGHILASICDDYDTLHIYDWNESDILNKEVTFMNGKLHHTTKYTYNSDTETYSAELFSCNGKLLRVETDISKSKFYRV